MPVTFSSQQDTLTAYLAESWTTTALLSSGKPWMKW